MIVARGGEVQGVMVIFHGTVVLSDFGFEDGRTVELQPGTWFGAAESSNFSNGSLCTARAQGVCDIRMIPKDAWSRAVNECADDRDVFFQQITKELIQWTDGCGLSELSIFSWMPPRARYNLVYSDFQVKLLQNGEKIWAPDDNCCALVLLGHITNKVNIFLH